METVYIHIRLDYTLKTYTWNTLLWHLSLAVTFVEAKLRHLSLAVTFVEAKLWHLSLAVTFVEAKLWHLSLAVTFVETMLWHLSLAVTFVEGCCDICRGLWHLVGLWHLSAQQTISFSKSQSVWNESFCILERRVCRQPVYLEQNKIKWFSSSTSFVSHIKKSP